MGKREDSILSKSISKSMKKASREEIEEVSEIQAEQDQLRNELRESTCLTKEDIGSDFTGNEELHRLFFNTTKYNDKIVDIRQALRSGVNIVNVVSPGVSSSPGREITDLIIQTALQHESTLEEDSNEESVEADRKARSESRSDSIVGDIKFATDQEPVANISSLENKLLGGKRYNKLSPRNVVLAWAMANANINLDEDDKNAIYAKLMSMRADDIVYDVDNPETYCYTCYGVEGSDINVSTVENAAQNVRNSMKGDPSNVPDIVSDRIKDIYYGINAALGNDYARSFFPYGIEVEEDDYSRGIKKAIAEYRGERGKLSLPDYSKASIKRWVIANSYSWPSESSVSSIDSETDFTSEVSRHVKADDKLFSMFISGNEDERIEFLMGVVNAYREKYSNVKEKFASISWGLQSVITGSVDNLYNYAVSNDLLQNESSEDNAPNSASDLMPIPENASVSTSVGFGASSPSQERETNESESEDLSIPEFPDGNDARRIYRWLNRAVFNGRVPARTQDNSDLDVRSAITTSILENVDSIPRAKIQMVCAILIKSAFVNSPSTMYSGRHDDAKQNRSNLANEIARHIISTSRSSSFLMNKMFKSAQSNRYSEEFAAMVSSIMDTAGDDRAAIGPAKRAYVENYVATAVRGKLVARTKSITTGSSAIKSGRSISVSMQNVADSLGVPYDSIGRDVNRALVQFPSNAVVHVNGSPITIQISNATLPMGMGRGEIMRYLNQNVVFQISAADANKVEDGEIQFVIPNEYGEVANYEVSEFASQNFDDDNEKMEFMNKFNMMRSRFGIQTNSGQLPNWAPDPYDFRPTSSAHVGHSNNMDGLREGLAKRIKLRSYYEEQMNASGGQFREMYDCAVRRVSDEINQMSNCMRWVEESFPDEVKWAPGANVSGIETEGRNASNSALRYADKNSDDFYSDVSTRCRKAGLNVPTFGVNFGLKEYRSLLSREDFEKMYKIYQKVNEDWRRSLGSSESAPSYLIARGFDAIGEGDENSQMPIMRRMRDVLATYSAAVSNAKALRSAVVIVTENPVNDNIIKDLSVSIVHIGANIISSDEIQQYVELYEREVKQKRLLIAKDEREESFISRFSVPSHLVNRLSAGLSSLNMSKIKDYIASVVSQMFEMYLKSGNMNSVNQTFKVSVEKDILEHQSDADMSENLNIESRVPMISEAQYLTRKGSSWHAFNNQFGDKMIQIKSADEKHEMLSRVVSSGIAPVKMSGDGKVEFALKGFGLTWMSLGNEPLPSAEEMQTLSADFEDVFGAVGAPQDLPAERSIDISERNRIRSVINSKVEELRDDILIQKRNAIPNIIFLYGEPGSGKSIFPDVMASELGLRLMVTSLTDIFLASSEAQWRGQSERRISDFVELCRNTKNAVILLDEFHKFFAGGSQSSADYINTVSEKLQTAWNDHKPIYKENNLYIVCTSNLDPKHFSGSGGASALMNRFEAKENIPVPSNLESLMAFFTSDTMMTNIVNSSFGDPRVGSKIHQMIKAYEQGDADLVKILADGIKKLAGAQAFSNGMLMPGRCRDKLFESKNINALEESGNDAAWDKVVDFIEGWLSTREIFRSMAEPKDVATSTGHVVEVSPLEQICRLLEKKMEWAKLTNAEQNEFDRVQRKIIDGVELTEAEQRRNSELEAKQSGETDLYSKASMRQLNEISMMMLRSHQDFLSGDQKALPLNWKTFWFSVNLTSWSAVSDEAAGSPEVSEQQRSMPDNEVNGWSKLIEMSKDEIAKNVGIVRESFMTEQDIRHIEQTVYSGVQSDASIQGAVSQGLSVRSEYIFGSAVENLRLTTNAYQSRMEEFGQISISKGGRVDGPVMAKFFGDISEAHSNMKMAAISYDSDKSSEEAQQALVAANERIVHIMNDYGSKGIGGIIASKQSYFASARLSPTRGSGENTWLRTVLAELSNYVNLSSTTANIDSYIGDESEFEQSLNKRVASNQEQMKAIFENASSQFHDFANIGETVSDEIAVEALNRAKELGIELPKIEDAPEEAEIKEQDDAVVNESLEWDFGEQDQSETEPQPGAPVIPDAGALAIPDEGAVSEPVQHEEDEEDEEEEERAQRRNASGTLHIVAESLDITSSDNVSDNKSSKSSTDHLYNALESAGVIEGLKVAQTVEPLVFDEDIAGDVQQPVQEMQTQEQADVEPNVPRQVANQESGYPASVFDLDGNLDAIRGILGIRKALNKVSGLPTLDVANGMANIIFPEE